MLGFIMKVLKKEPSKMLKSNNFNALLLDIEGILFRSVI
jgi:hypothetical protein